MLTFNLEMQLHYENVNVVSIFIHCQLNCIKVPDGPQ